MKSDAEAHAEEDRRRKELVEVRNNADNTIYAAEKLLRENGDKIPENLKKEVEESVSKLRGTTGEENADQIRTATENLNQVIQKIGASMYQQPESGAQESGGASGADQSGTSGGNPPTGESGDVVDGEFKNL